MAALAQPLHQVEDLGGLLDAEGGGGLVEDDELGLAQHGAGDRHGLALTAGERGDGDTDTGDPDGQGGQELAGAALHLHLVEDAEALELPAEEEVADDIDVVAQRQVLVHRRDAQVLGVVGLADGDRAPLPLDDAVIDGVHAGDRLDQRGLAGTVVAHQGDHFTGVDLEFYVGQGLNGTEPLRDPSQRQHGRSGHMNHLLRRLTGGDVVQKRAGAGRMGERFCPAPRRWRG